MSKTKARHWTAAVSAAVAVLLAIVYIGPWWARGLAVLTVGVLTYSLASA